MKRNFNVTKENRKAFAKAISDLTGEPAVYKFMPTYSFEIGNLTVNRDGTLSAPDDADLTALIDGLKEKGFHLEENEITNTEETAAPEEHEGTSLTIEVPITSANVGTLTNLIAAKESLIKKALGASDTRITVTEDKIAFPWFDRELTPDESNAAMLFITALCRLSKEQKRASAKETPAENEKYAFRCFLLRLGFIGPEYKEARKILLQNLTGSAAFRNGAPAKEAKA